MPGVTVVPCGVCKQQLKNAHLLPCLHAFCLRCLEDECTQHSRDKFFCPMCIVDNKKSTTSRPWHALENFLESEEVEDARRKRQAELPISETRKGSIRPTMDIDDGSDDDEEVGVPKNDVEDLQIFPCPSHVDRTVESYCGKCNQVACEKCVSTFHRRCKVESISSAVASRSDVIDRLHGQIADSLVQCEIAQDFHTDRIKAIEEIRTKTLIEIKSQRQALVNMILEKEKALTDELNNKLNALNANFQKTEATAASLADSLSAQLNVLDVCLRAKGQGEILSYLPSLSQRMQVLPNFDVPEEPKITYRRDDSVANFLQSASLGDFSFNDQAKDSSDSINVKKGEPIIELTPVLGFHGGSRDDQCDPLLTDLLVLANGDVIITDRDNKCVKKFNNSGKLLTRVAMDAVPSRITSVSHSRAVVSAMNKKALYFLSLHGTVRILNYVKVKKIYSFLTSVGGGLLAAGTSQCDAIDLLTDKGLLVRQLYTQRTDRAAICRPLYLTTSTPHAGIHSFVHTHTEQGKADNTTRKTATKPTAPTAATNGHDGVKIPDLIVSDSGKRVVFKLTSDGAVTSTLKSKDKNVLECPLGITVHDSGHALLVDRDSDTILQLDQDNRWKRQVLTAADGISKPCGIYAGHKGQVAISQVDGMVKLYTAKVSYK